MSRSRAERVIRCDQCGAWRHTTRPCVTCAMGVDPGQLTIRDALDEGDRVDPWQQDDVIADIVDDVLGESDH